MSHVVLLGDSMCDNARYVPGGPSVIEHLRPCLPGGWRATLLARDGAGTAEMARQLDHRPADADDYAKSSPIEPSVEGGGKIARAVARMVTEHDFKGDGSRVFA